MSMYDAFKYFTRLAELVAGGSDRGPLPVPADGGPDRAGAGGGHARPPLRLLRAEQPDAPRGDAPKDKPLAS
ncbi:MAG TPA: hypothetical protein VL961_07925 [Acidimicrobiales bacterium]|nr:hypothetical protein [Acidimicrobiales bacterium]